MSYKRIYRCVVLACLLVLINCAAIAAIRMPAIFSDNMVLQRDLKVPIWGWADPGSKLEITFLNKTFKTVAGADGKWRTKLDVYKAGGPYTMLIKSGSEELQFKNILIGDVWLTSGQSNMEFGIQTERNGAEAIKNATDTLLHFFDVPMTYSLQPLDDTPAPADSPNGKWVVCSPAMLANPKWAWHGFSAVGYYFVQQIRQKAGVPVGMIASYKGGTPAQAWISNAGLQQSPAFDKYVMAHKTLVEHFDNAKAAYPQQLADYKVSIAKWNDEVGKGYDSVKKAWTAAVALAKANGESLPILPKPSRPAPVAPADPAGGFGAPSNCYNAMIAPLETYGLKGVIWYQGESNGDRIADAVEYNTLFPRLIQNWRNNWKQRDLPFLFVQLTNYRAPAVSPSEGNWAWVREAQLKTLSLPQTGMAVITDLGEAENIHPLNKQDVGLRLARVARHEVYGENVVFSGPVYQSMQIEGNKIRLNFDNSDLVTDSIRHPGSTELKGFGIAGDDQKFVWAKAVIEGNSVIVWADGISNPVAVRYNWADNPPGNLYNKEGLPASSFRTDSWAPPLIVK